MSIAESLLSELDAEAKATRSYLERVPANRVTWRPHPKSSPLGRLALHVANLPTWTRMTLGSTQLDVDPPGGAGRTPPTFESVEALLAVFDRNIADARDALAAASDADFDIDWSLVSGSKVLFTLPRRAVLRRMVFNHTVHHRAQLGVYLRMLGVPLPPIYGPTADDMARAEPAGQTA
jgi:uncharacterized damage-inducible protein DinB